MRSEDVPEDDVCAVFAYGTLRLRPIFHLVSIAEGEISATRATNGA